MTRINARNRVLVIILMFVMIFTAVAVPVASYAEQTQGAEQAATSYNTTFDVRDAEGKTDADESADSENADGSAVPYAKREANDKKVINGFSVGDRYTYTADYDKKILELYIPESTNRFSFTPLYDSDDLFISGKITYKSAYKHNFGDTITRSIKGKKEINFNSSGETPTCIESGTYEGASADMVFTTTAGTENWTVNVVRVSDLSSMTASAPPGGTAKLSGFTMFATKDISLVATGDSVKLTMKPYLQNIEKAYVTVDGERAEQFVTQNPGGEKLYSYTYDLPLTDEYKKTVCVRMCCDEPRTMPREYIIEVTHNKTQGVTDIALNPKELVLTAASPSAEVTATVTNTDSSDYTLNWSVENQYVAQVAVDGQDQTKAVVSGIADGMTTLTVTDGYIVTSIPVSVETQQQTTMLKTVQAASSAWGSGVPYETIVDKDAKTITTAVCDASGTFAVRPVLNTGVNVKKILLRIKTKNGDDRDIDFTENALAGKFTFCGGVNSPLEEASLDGAEAKLIISSETETEEWSYIFTRFPQIKALSLSYNDGRLIPLTPKFARTNTSYTIWVGASTETVILNAEPYTRKTPVYVGDMQADENGSYELALTGERTEATVRAGDAGLGGTEYTVTAIKVPEAKIKFKVNVDNAVISIVDSNHDGIYPENGEAALPLGLYTYSVTARGYVSKFGQISVLNSDPQTITVQLQRVAESTLKDLPAQWPSFRGNNDNTGVTSYRTPTNRDALKNKWKQQIGAALTASSISPCIIVDNTIVGYTANTLVKLDRETGTILQSAAMGMNTGFALMPPVYGGGMIFVPGSGMIKAYNAETFELLWTYTDAMGGTVDMGMRYEDGYLYAGFFRGADSANMVCIDTADEDPATGEEIKRAVWTTKSIEGGFKWSGFYATDKTVIIDSSGLTDETHSYLYCLDKRTGKMLQKLDCIGSGRASVAYYDGRIYFPTTTGYLYSYNLTPEGLLDTENMIEPLYTGSRSTSTPAIYNGRLYIGMAGGSVGQFPDAGILVVNIEPATGTMTPAYIVPTDGNPQSSGCLSTAYTESAGYNYVYFTTNTGQGPIYMVKDKPGMTEPDPESGLFWKPDTPQFCIASIIADSEGTLYYKNDSATMWAIEEIPLSIDNLTAEGGNAVLDEGQGWNGEETEHTIIVDSVTASVTLNFEASQGTSVWIGDVSGLTHTVELVGGKADVEVRAVSGANSKTYTIHIASVAEAAQTPAEITASRGDEISVTMTYTVCRGDITEVDFTDTFDTSKLNRISEVVSDNISASYQGIDGNGNAVVKSLAGNLPETGSITYTYKVIAECAVEPSDINGKVTLKSGNEVKFTFDSLKTTVTFSHRLTKVEAEEALCERDGNTEYWICDACGRVFDDEAGERESTVEAHVIKALGHDWDEGVVTVKPTVHSEGVMTYTCRRDPSHTKTEVIPKLNVGYQRIFGSTRFDTAIEVAEQLKKDLGKEKFDCIVVASGADYPDALSGAYLSKVNGAPLLLVNIYTVDKVGAYIEANLNEGGRVYLLGGPAILPESLDTRLQNAGATVKRLYGADRYATNIEILKEAGVKAEDILICSGNMYADALSASAAGKPILLVNTELAQVQKAYLSTLNTENLFVIGGAGVVPEQVRADAEKYGKVKRIFGSTRYETSVAVAKEFFGDAFDSVTLAYALDYPDGLAGGPLALANRGPLLLVSADEANNRAAAEYIGGAVAGGFVLGGPTFVPDDAVKYILGIS